VSVSGRQRRDQPSLRVDDGESLSAIDGLVLDLQPQFRFDQLTELVVLGWVVWIDAEQELLIVRIEKGVSAQGGRMGADSQTAPELIDVGLVELPEPLAIERQLAADDLGWAQARVSQAQPRGATNREAPSLPSCREASAPLLLLTPRAGTEITT
jgi:hypothetical protein